MFRLIDKIPDPILKVCRVLHGQGARSWLVGGCVRDLYLEVEPKDFDLEVYGLTMSALHHVLQPLGHCQHVGKSFSVLKFFYHGMVLDMALPRTERKIGQGHRAFEVQANEHLSPKKASQRRDFTMNAMMFDPLSGDFLDEHQGRDDLDEGVIRHVSSAFSEDPLRVLRGMQFAARFQLRIHPSTAQQCHILLDEAGSLSRERVWSEWEKWALSSFPADGLRFLEASGWRVLYPELEALACCEQDVIWHPEGNVWQHTAWVVDQAAWICQRNHWAGKKRLTLVFAALCHDLGKPETTQVGEDRRVHSYGHAQAGVAVTRSFLKKISAPAWLCAQVIPLVAQHLSFAGATLSDRAIRRLAVRLQPATIELWEALIEADQSGRPPLAKSRPALSWLQAAQVMQHDQRQPVMIVTGKCLLAWGMSSGPAMGVVMKKAYEAQLDGVFENEEQAKKWFEEEALPRA